MPHRLTALPRAVPDAGPLRAALRASQRRGGSSRRLPVEVGGRRGCADGGEGNRAAVCDIDDGEPPLPAVYVGPRGGLACVARCGGLCAAADDLFTCVALE